MRSDGGHPWRLLALLIAISAVGPLSLNILAPAMPGLIGTLGAGAGTVQLTLSLFLLGMAVSQLVLGTLSDRFGRRPVMLAGLALTVVASFAALATSSIAGLIVARTAQAFGATAGIVIGRAVIRDLYDRDRAASMIGWVTMAMVVAPMIAPLIGGALDTALGWHVDLRLPRPVRRGRPRLGVVRAARDAEGRDRRRLRALSLRPRAACSATARSSATRWSRRSTRRCSSPSSAARRMSSSPSCTAPRPNTASGFVAISLAYMAGNFAAGRWSAKYGVDFMVRAGVAVTVAGAAVGIVWVLLEPARGPEVIMVPQMIIGFASGFMLPNALAGAVSVRPQAAGAAAGITGFMQMGLGAATSQLIGHLLDGAQTGLPLAAIVLVLCACGLVAFFTLVRK